MDHRQRRARGIQRQLAAMEALRHHRVARERLSGAILKAIDAGDNGPGGGTTFTRKFTPLYDARRKLVGKRLYTVLGVPRGDAAGIWQFRRCFPCSSTRRSA